MKGMDHILSAVSAERRIYRLCKAPNCAAADELLRCGWMFLTAATTKGTLGEQIYLGQVAPFICPTCGAALEVEDVRIDFILGHKVHCQKCGDKRLGDGRLDEYFVPSRAAGHNINGETTQD